MHPVSSRFLPRVNNVGTVAATATTYDMTYVTIPATLWVRPTSGNTLTVDYSTDNAANFQSLTGLTGATAYTEVTVTAPFTNLKITPSGTQGGTWGVC